MTDDPVDPGEGKAPPAPGGDAKADKPAPVETSGPPAEKPAAPVARPAAPAAGAGAPGAPGAPTAPAAPAAPRVPKVDPVEQALRAEVPSVPLDRLKSRMPGAIEEVTYFAGVPIVRVQTAEIERVCRFLKDDPDSDMKYLSSLCGAHYPDRPAPFDVVYHLYSITKNHRLELKARTDDATPVPSVTGVWRTANWHEREAFDMYGIRFEGHPDLKRVLLPDDWVGHPLRKDYPLEGNPGDHKVYRRE